MKKALKIAFALGFVVAMVIPSEGSKVLTRTKEGTTVTISCESTDGGCLDPVIIES